MRGLRSESKLAATAALADPLADPPRLTTTPLFLPLQPCMAMHNAFDMQRDRQAMVLQRSVGRPRWSAIPIHDRHVGVCAPPPRMLYP